MPESQQVWGAPLVGGAALPRVHVEGLRQGSSAANFLHLWLTLLHKNSEFWIFWVCGNQCLKIWSHAGNFCSLINFQYLRFKAFKARPCCTCKTVNKLSLLANRGLVYWKASKTTQTSWILVMKIIFNLSPPVWYKATTLPSWKPQNCPTSATNLPEHACAGYHY